MALEKTITLPTGVEANYWKIVKLISNFKLNHEIETLIEINLFLNKEQRDNLRQPLERRSYNFHGEMDIDTAYRMLKELEQQNVDGEKEKPFFDAKDC